MQGPGVQLPERLIPAVGPLHQVRDRDVHVQLRVPVPADVMGERRRDQARPVPPFPRRSRVVTSPGVARFGFGALDGEPGHRLEVGLDPVRLRVQLPRTSPGRPVLTPLRAAILSEACSTETLLAADTVRS